MTQFDKRNVEFYKYQIKFGLREKVKPQKKVHQNNDNPIGNLQKVIFKKCIEITVNNGFIGIYQGLSFKCQGILLLKMSKILAYASWRMKQKIAFYLLECLKNFIESL